MFETAKKQLRIPMSKPEVYKPLLLIITITCLQHFSGFTFTKKFLLQILSPAKKFEEGVSGGEVPNDPEEEEYTGYYFAILINTIRTAANLLMSDFLKRSKVKTKGSPPQIHTAGIWALSVREAPAQEKRCSNGTHP